MADLTVERINQMKHAELKEQLQLLGMPSTGRKNSLKERLLGHLEQVQADSATRSPAEPSAETDLQEATTAEVQPVSNGRDQAEVAPPPVEEATVAPKETQPETTTASPPSTKVEPPVEPVATETAAQAVDSEEEKRRRRAERFGLTALQDAKVKNEAAEEPKAKVPVTNEAVAVDEETLRKRRERFGAVTTQNLAAAQVDTSPKSSVQPTPRQPDQPVSHSVWSETDEEKKRKRAERFAQKPLISVSELFMKLDQ
ncbi:hypothetical protein IWQ62_006402 [Dispira parvispora]|uniref:SAP domain-containing protein n=1 Tax=Dispira parvispora TaxID=1520584 RepID=A0A9W8ANM1_9FUNG|nr:hypothetical protein IWQ62_006402 [Dispira parvispora]